MQLAANRPAYRVDPLGLGHRLGPVKQYIDPPCPSLVSSIRQGGFLGPSARYRTWTNPAGIQKMLSIITETVAIIVAGALSFPGWQGRWSIIVVATVVMVAVAAPVVIAAPIASVAVVVAVVTAAAIAAK